MRFPWWPDPSNMLVGIIITDDFAFLRESPQQRWEVGPQDHDLFGDGSMIL